MRHGRKFNHLGRTCGQRKALLKGLAISLIKHKKIVTTLAKAKELRVFIEPLLTLSKDNSTHSRRLVFSKLTNKEACKELFNNISGHIINRNGGYTRIIKLGNRFGDGSKIALIMFVDYNFYEEIDTKDNQKS